MAIEQFNELGEVSERAGETVDLIDYDDVNLSGPYVRQQLL